MTITTHWGEKKPFETTDGKRFDFQSDAQAHQAKLGGTAKRKSKAKGQKSMNDWWAAREREAEEARAKSRAKAVEKLKRDHPDIVRRQREIDEERAARPPASAPRAKTIDGRVKAQRRAEKQRRKEAAQLSELQYKLSRSDEDGQRAARMYADSTPARGSGSITAGEHTGAVNRANAAAAKAAIALGGD